MEIETADIIKIYKDVALSPTVSSAALQVFPDKNLVKIQSLWSVSDLVKAESTKFTQEFLLQSNSQKCSLLSKGFPEESSASLCAFTKSKTKFAVYRKSKKNEESAFLEIWNLSQKEKTFDMKERKEHGNIHDNSNLKSFEWSANEKYLLYIAEAKQKKTESYFKNLFCDTAEQKPPAEKTEQKPSEETIKGEDNLYRETWGESHSTAHHSVLCIFDVETGKVEVLNLDDKFPGTSIAQATWGPNDEYIVFVGYNENPSRLGLVYCINRRSSIYFYNLETKDVVCLTLDENICAEYPVFSPNFECFVFLQNKSVGPHMSCRKLMKITSVCTHISCGDSKKALFRADLSKRFSEACGWWCADATGHSFSVEGSCDWKSKEISTVIDIIDNANATDFAGIYITRLSPWWWSNDSRFFFFHTFRRSFLEIFYIDILSSKVRKINIDKSYGTCVLHDVKDPYILISVSSPNIKPQLMIGHFSYSDDGIQVTWSSFNENPDSCLQDLSWSVYTLKPSLPNECYPDLDYDILVVRSTEKNNGTLIIFPHGGPHSIINATFFVIIAAFARLGYTLCMVNYRGSIGLGENSVQSLLGNVGKQDVSDVVQAVEYLKQNEEFAIKQVVGFGGSHGGFLIAHLLGQYPDLLKAAVIRNPVIDLTTMADTTDIPDWCWAESGKTYDPLNRKDSSILDEMWKKSPIRYIENVKSPTLLCLGKVDLRVPPSQGLLFHRYLKAQGVPTKVYYYDDNHALSKVAVSSDVFMQSALWFQSHLSS